jgi:nucleotide-binding universal stress UspA family protein
MTRIIVGLDGSVGSRGALSWAFDQAKATGAEIDAVLAYSSGVAWIDVGSEFQEPMMHEARRQAQRALDEILAEEARDTSIPLRGVVAEGAPADVLVEAAGAADLLVVGSRGRGGFAGLLLGSVSQRCVERAPCPVVVVPKSDEPPDA